MAPGSPQEATLLTQHPPLLTQHPHIPPSGRGAWALQVHILGQLGVNWIFPHSKTLFFGGQLGPNLTHLGANLGPIWIKIGQEGQLGAIWRQSGGILGHSRQQSPKLTEICSKNTPKLVFSKGFKYWKNGPGCSGSNIFNIYENRIKLIK